MFMEFDFFVVNQITDELFAIYQWVYILLLFFFQRMPILISMTCAIMSHLEHRVL